jgi:hypothetical protein
MRLMTAAGLVLLGAMGDVDRRAIARAARVAKREREAREGGGDFRGYGSSGQRRHGQSKEVS